ncbi:SOS response-associated peptidase [Aerococcus agrisoli]|uniref:Abasic site processing protein n=1 Tax=Aerococcus agrisoli TaxID=2487350 RepID=A0A3N4GML9_9LACT|nr:SOS response-associated peptidase family protein [Aerococcus agrisoli]RPA59820.1 SOS response-associated peptidase [Aerococcus agrisoli]
MCGRYLYDKSEQVLLDYYNEIRQRGVEIPDAATDIIYPSSPVITLGANPEKEIVPALTKWGFTGFKPSQLLINARVETARDKPMFKESFETRRIIFPMSGFYEFSANKKAYTFSEPNNILYVGGFYRMYSDPKTGQRQAESIIITTEPDTVVGQIHDRMPLLIAEKDVKQWILDDTFAYQYQHPVHQNLQAQAV